MNGLVPQADVPLNDVRNSLVIPRRCFFNTGYSGPEEREGLALVNTAFAPSSEIRVVHEFLQADRYLVRACLPQLESSWCRDAAYAVHTVVTHEDALKVSERADGGGVHWQLVVCVLKRLRLLLPCEEIHALAVDAHPVHRRTRKSVNSSNTSFIEKGTVDFVKESWM